MSAPPAAVPAAVPAVTPVAGTPPRAYVGFGGDAGLRWLRLLKPGFRHCFLILNDGRHWLTLDPMAGWTEVAVQPVPAAFDLIEWYRQQGFLVVPATIRAQPARPLPLAPFTCVEAVKRALGLRAWRVLTPHQLFRRLLADGRRRLRAGALHPQS